MQLFLSIPEPLQAAIVFLVALIVGGQINRGIYRLAFDRRSIDPWSPPMPKAPPRKWFDRLPVLGWFGLQREEKLHGTGHWIRPAMIELALACGLTMLFFHVIRGNTVEEIVLRDNPQLKNSAALGALFISHAALICLMTVATFIDFDEKTIPDAITGPGTILGLGLAALWPEARLIIPDYLPDGTVAAEWLQVASPQAWPRWFDHWQGVALGCACLVAWCWAMVPTLCTLRRGWKKGIQFYLASFFSGPYWLRMLATAVVGCPLIVAVWWFGSSDRWEALLTQLVGMVVGGGLVWAVRICASLALRKEAMGFGDVTLMAMIGAFLGWQATLLVFFLSPAGAVIVALAQFFVTKKREIAFGPYLCLAAVFLMVGWPLIWPQVEGVFWLGWIVPGLFLACLGLMCGMLMFWRMFEELVFRDKGQR